MGTPHVRELRHLGFDVVWCQSWPKDDELFTRVEAVVVALRDVDEAISLAMRLRARRHFDRRVLIATVDDRCAPADLRSARVAGVDWVFPASVGTRVLAARLLRVLRSRSEHQCHLPPDPAADERRVA